MTQVYDQRVGEIVEFRSLILSDLNGNRHTEIEYFFLSMQCSSINLFKSCCLEIQNSTSRSNHGDVRLSSLQVGYLKDQMHRKTPSKISLSNYIKRRDKLLNCQKPTKAQTSLNAQTRAFFQACQPESEKPIRSSMIPTQPTITYSNPKVVYYDVPATIYHHKHSTTLTTLATKDRSSLSSISKGKLSFSTSQGLGHRQSYSQLKLHRDVSNSLMEKSKHKALRNSLNNSNHQTVNGFKQVESLYLLQSQTKLKSHNSYHSPIGTLNSMANETPERTPQNVTLRTYTFYRPHHHSCSSRTITQQLSPITKYQFEVRVVNPLHQ